MRDGGERWKWTSKSVGLGYAEESGRSVVRKRDWTVEDNEKP